MKHYKFRSAVEEDIPQIDTLLRALGEHVGETDEYVGKRSALSEYGFGNTPMYHALISEEDNILIGLCNYYPTFSTWRCEPGVYVLDLFIHQDYRGKKLGNQLLVATAQDATSRWKSSYMQLHVNKDNSSAQAFYQAIGFEIDEAHHLMTLEGEAFEAFQQR